MSRVEFEDLRGYTSENWHVTFVRDTNTRLINDTINIIHFYLKCTTKSINDERYSFAPILITQDALPFGRSRHSSIFATFKRWPKFSMNHRVKSRSSLTKFSCSVIRCRSTLRYIPRERIEHRRRARITKFDGNRHSSTGED